MEEFLGTLAVDRVEAAMEYIRFSRYAVPVLAGLLLLRCALPLLTFRREPEIWAWLNLPSGEQIPLTHWENIIGRSGSCDVTINFPTVSRNHAVLTRYDDGSWTISDAVKSMRILRSSFIRKRMALRMWRYSLSPSLRFELFPHSD